MDLAREKKASDEGSVRMTEADRLLLNSAITSTWHHIRGYLAKGRQHNLVKDSYYIYVCTLTVSMTICIQVEIREQV